MNEHGNIVIYKDKNGNNNIEVKLQDNTVWLNQEQLVKLYKNNLIPKELTKEQINYIYAEEADVLNMALFGMTAKKRRENTSNKDGNIRDYASIDELICLANLENLNSVFINDGLSQPERLKRLNKIAISQMKILTESNFKYLKHNEDI